MSIQHAALTGADLHEPKGAATAQNNAAYVANGAGSGAWTIVKDLNVLVITMFLPDLGTAASNYVVCPIAGTITKAYTVLNGSLTTADAVLTLKIGGAAVTNGTITITQSGSASGDIDSCTPAAGNAVAAGQAIEVALNGGPANNPSGMITFVLDIT